MCVIGEQIIKPHPVDVTFHILVILTRVESAATLVESQNAKKALWIRQLEVTSWNSVFLCWATIFCAKCLNSGRVTYLMNSSNLFWSRNPANHRTLTFFLSSRLSRHFCYFVGFYTYELWSKSIFIHIKYQDRVKYSKSKKTNVIFVFFRTTMKKITHCFFFPSPSCFGLRLLLLENCD